MQIKKWALTFLVLVIGVLSLVGFAACDNSDSDKGNGDLDREHAHNYVLIGEVDATCTEYGSKSYQCSVCGEEYQDPDSVVAATGHDMQPVSTAGSCESWTYAASGTHFSRILLVAYYWLLSL